MTTPKNVIRRFPPFASFQKFLVAENDVGNITRQEVVSMIPPLVMGIKPGMTVLDLCAAPGSKSGQIMELLHAGEEERVRTVAKHLANGLDRPEGEDYEDDGRSTGLLIANDVDYKRAHMLVHQMKRLSSPNLIVTNHDATIYPSIKLPSGPSKDGKPVPNRYLKFDRILADVPCSGDGTARKNLEIWNKWNPSNGLGLHAQQTRILVRALQMLKVGGRVVYSTCSMNPVEDEAVLVSAIAKCGGLSQVEVIPTDDLLPGLTRSPGLTTWKIMDKYGRIWNDHQEVLNQKDTHGEEGLSRLQESMFPPKDPYPLERCMRVYPHQQDTGAFFIAILEKRSEIKVHSEKKPTVTAPPKLDVAESTGVTNQITTTPDGDMTTDDQMDGNATTNVLKTKRTFDGADDEVPNAKRAKVEESQPQGSNSDTEKPDTDVILEEKASRLENGDTISVAESDGKGGAKVTHSLRNTPAQILEQSDANKKPRKTQKEPFEEPFKYISPEIEELESIRQFYKMSTRFPQDRFMVRNAQGTAAKNIYYTSALAKAILQENEGKGMKFVHSGIKMFVKQDVPRPEVCPWRIQTDGLPVVESWVGPERVVELWKKETLRKLLIEMFPKFADDEWKNLDEIGQQILSIGMGCCVLICEPSVDAEGLPERMVFPLWKSLQSLNLMLPKEDRRAMLLRLFNDERPLINTQLNKQKPLQEMEKKEEPEKTEVARRNSSSGSEAES